MKPREPMMINEVTPEGTVANDLTIGEYDVVIGTQPARDSFDETQFAEALSLKSVGVPVPDDMIVEYSHLQRKEELARRIRIMTGQEPPTEEEAQLMQFQQEAQIRQIQIEIAKLEAEVGKIQSESALNIAKVQDLSEVNPQIQLSKIQAELQMRREELALRQNLSDMSNQVRQGQAELQSATKIATTAMQGAAKDNKNTDRR